MFNLFVAYWVYAEDEKNWSPSSLVLEDIPGSVTDQGDLLVIRDLVCQARELEEHTVVIHHFQLLGTEAERYEQVICPFCHHATMSHVCPPRET